MRVSAQIYASDTSSPGEWVVCSVLDAGSGIPPDQREWIFEKFTQLALPQSEREPGQRVRGSGIGLNFCKLTVEAHGGRIWVEDGPDGKGSDFKFILPLAADLPEAGI